MNTFIALLILFIQFDEYVRLISGEYLIMQKLGNGCNGVDAIGEDHLKLHQELLTQLVTAKVNYSARDWDFWNLCVRPTIPTMKSDFRGMLQRFVVRFPMCQISGPLECFNEGGAVRGPRPPIHLPSIVRWVLGKSTEHIHWQNTIPSDFLKSIEGVAGSFLQDGTVDEVLQYYNVSGLKPEVGYNRLGCYSPKTNYCPKPVDDMSGVIHKCSGSLLTGGTATPIYGQKEDGTYDVIITSLKLATPELMIERLKSGIENPVNLQLTPKQVEDVHQRWRSQLDSIVGALNSSFIVGDEVNADPGEIVELARSKFNCGTKSREPKTSLKTVNAKAIIPSLAKLIKRYMALLIGR